MIKRSLGVFLLILLISPLAEAQLAQRNECPQFTSDFGLGSRDASTAGAVTELQRFLAKNPTLYPEGLVTGYYGNLTKRAVQRFQASKGISQTGYVGPLTRDAVARSCASGTQPTTNTPVTFVVTPITGKAPLTSSYQMNFGNRACNESFILDAGDGSSVSSNGAGGAQTFQTCGAVTLHHIYQNIGTYLAKLDRVLTVQGVSTRQTVASASVVVSNAVATSSSISMSFSAPQGGTTVKRGTNLPISWATQNAPSGSKVRLEVYAVGTAPSTSNNENGLSSALAATASYNWAVPKATKQLTTDSGLLSGLPNGQYRIVGKLYSGDSCWGFCVASERTVHATTESAAFSIVSGEPPVPGTPLSTHFSVDPTVGEEPLTVTFSTKFPTTRPANPKYYIDFDDSTAEWVADCSGDGCSTPGVNTHTFAKTGVFDVWLVMRTFEETCAGEGDCVFTDKVINRQSVSVGVFGSSGAKFACYMNGQGVAAQTAPTKCGDFTQVGENANSQQCQAYLNNQAVCTAEGWSGGTWGNGYLTPPRGTTVACTTSNGHLVPGNVKVLGSKCFKDDPTQINCDSFYICKRDGWWRLDAGGFEMGKEPAPWVDPSTFYQTNSTGGL